MGVTHHAKDLGDQAAGQRQLISVAAAEKQRRAAARCEGLCSGPRLVPQLRLKTCDVDILRSKGQDV